MSRQSYTVREATTKKKGLHPIWRGIGCVLLVVMTVGGYLLAGFLLDLNNQNHYMPAIPQRLPSWEVIEGFTIPGRMIIQVGFMLVLDVVVYAIMVVIYSLLNPPKLGPLDAPPARRKKGRRDSELR